MHKLHMPSLLLNMHTVEYSVIDEAYSDLAITAFGKNSVFCD